MHRLPQPHGRSRGAASRDRLVGRVRALPRTGAHDRARRSHCVRWQPHGLPGLPPSTDARVKAAIAEKSTACAACHSGADTGHEALHVSPGLETACTTCQQRGNLVSEHLENQVHPVDGADLRLRCPRVVGCRSESAIASHDKRCSACHGASPHAESHAVSGGCTAAGCHAADATAIHAAIGCGACHAVGKTPSLTCVRATSATRTRPVPM